MFKFLLGFNFVCVLANIGCLIFGEGLFINWVGLGFGLAGVVLCADAIDEGRS